MDEDALITDEATEERVIQFIELSQADQALALSLLEQAKKLRKVCPECDGDGFKLCTDPDCPTCSKLVTPGYSTCEKCDGKGSIPVGSEDVEVRVK